MLNDTFNKYTWDAEGKNLSTAYGEGGGELWNFTYDAFGHKVEWLLNGSYYRSYVTLGKFKLEAVGQTVAYSEYPFPGGSLSSENGGDTGVQISDWQGTVRAFFNYTGGIVNQTGAHAPFGEAYAYAGGYPGSFTGEQNDGNMTNTTYYFPERQYRSSQGRWLSPDPAGLAAVDFSNPQSWNRYAYVLNNPLRATDPLGLWCVWDDGSGHDDDPADGGASQGTCTSQGGHWDSSDTLTNIFQDGNGNVTEIDTINGSLSGFGGSLSLSDVDSILASQSGALIISAAATNCSLLGRLWSATDFSLKGGFSLEASKYLSFDASINWTPSTNVVTANLGGSFAGFGSTAQKTLSYGDTVIGPAPNPTFTVNTPVSSTDLITGQTQPSGSGAFKLGGAFIGGAEISFDVASFNSATASCNAQQ